MLTRVGRKCGSIFIDKAFKKWLKEKLGEHYRELDPDHDGEIKSHAIEGPRMQALMKDFIAAKEAFGSQEQTEIRIHLPQPLDTLNEPERGINYGVFTISQ